MAVPEPPYCCPYERFRCFALRLAIEVLEEELESSGGPEDARARETLERLLEIARGPRSELVGFPQAAQTSE